MGFSLHEADHGWRQRRRPCGRSASANLSIGLGRTQLAL